MTYVIVDFEATCCDDGSVPRHEMEIIEFGAVALDGDGPHILGEFQSFVCPSIHPYLTPFCTKLTSITQDMVDDAPNFPQVLKDFRAWLQTLEDPIFCSWGNYDRNQLRQDCTYHKQPFPFSWKHINIKEKFAQNVGLPKGVGLGQALRKVGLRFVGKAHRGIDDARNMAALSGHIFL
ncbi:MAG: exonuclease domain-containing protein [Myxococcales bacterium]|nr:exonuclease domain-containing protein [Myxococcales bacterium]